MSLTIDWGLLAHVAEVAAAFAVGIVGVFALGVLGMARVTAARDGSGSAGGRVGGFALAGVAFALCASAVGYGLYLIIPQFH